MRTQHGRNKPYTADKTLLVVANDASVSIRSTLSIQSISAGSHQRTDIPNRTLKRGNHATTTSKIVSDHLIHHCGFRNSGSANRGGRIWQSMLFRLWCSRLFSAPVLWKFVLWKYRLPESILPAIASVAFFSVTKIATNVFIPRTVSLPTTNELPTESLLFAMRNRTMWNGQPLPSAVCSENANTHF